MARLQDMYKDKVVPELMQKFGYANRMAVPRLEKIVVNMGVGKATENKKRLEDAVRDLATITGQKPLVTLARKSVSAFKLRQGNAIGCKVTLRGKRMYEFLDRLITLAIPRVKDFRGLNPSAFDGRGNYNMGLVEQTVFPEIDPTTVTTTQGMNINFQTSAKTDEEARELLTMLGMPFKTS